jgi:K+-transporting ATPase KdpF subunit
VDSTSEQDALIELSSTRLAGRRDHVGYRMYRGKHPVFCHCDWIRDGMRPAQSEGETGMIETLLLGLITVLLLAYLVYALLRPEKF